MKQGDEVISMGDQWICPGSRGKIKKCKDDGTSAYVIWSEIPDGRHAPGTGLYHRQSSLRLVGSLISNPNIAFMIRERKRT